MWSARPPMPLVRLLIAAALLAALPGSSARAQDVFDRPSTRPLPVEPFEEEEDEVPSLPVLPAPPVIRLLDPRHDRSASLLPCGPLPSIEHILLQEREEGLHGRIVPGRADLSH